MHVQPPASLCLRGDTSPVPWKFAKFLVRKDGSVYGRYGPKPSRASLMPLTEKFLADSQLAAACRHEEKMAGALGALL